MSLFKSKAVLARSTTHIYRPYGGIADVREVTDRAAHVRVLDFPSTLISDIIASELACPAFYAMVGSGRIYLGENNNLGLVAAGSDIRITTNPSASAVNRARRAALFDAGVLSPIPGASDRMRLTVDVALPSMAIAAAVACGAHVDSSKWRAIDPNQRPLMHL